MDYIARNGNIPEENFVQYVHAAFVLERYYSCENGIVVELSSAECLLTYGSDKLIIFSRLYCGLNFPLFSGYVGVVEVQYSDPHLSTRS